MKFFLPAPGPHRPLTLRGSVVNDAVDEAEGVEERVLEADRERVMLCDTERDGTSEMEDV